MGISALLDVPFYEGAPVTQDVPWLAPVGLADHSYLIDLKRYRRATIPAQREGSDVQVEQSDASLNSRGLWRRSGADWRGGAGQAFFDDNDSSRSRFEASLGIDPWQRGCLGLLPETERKVASTAASQLLLAIGDWQYRTADAALSFTTDPTPAAPVYTAVTTTSAGTHTSLTTDGTSIFTADGTRIWKATLGAGSAAALGSYAADLVGYANGRLLAANGNELVEVAAAGTTTVVHTHPNAGFAWTHVMGAANGIYVAGKASGVSELYYIGVNDTTGALLPPIVAAPLPPGETVESLATTGGIVVIGTSRGLRLASPVSANHLAYGSVIVAPGVVRAIAVEGEFAWFSWDAMAPGASGVGRAKLDLFADAEHFVPAHATDVISTAAGATTGVVRFGSRTYFAVAGSGVWGASGRKVATGWLDTGRIRFGTYERKLPASVDLRHDPLAGTVSVAVLDETGESTDIGASTAQASLSPPAPFGAGTVGALEVVRLRLSLTRSATDDTAGPMLRRWTLRALVTPVRLDQILLPIVMARTVDVYGESTLAYDPLAEFSYLKALEARGTPVRYAEGRSSYLVYVDGVEIEGANGWVEDRSFFEATLLVHLTTMEPSA